MGSVVGSDADTPAGKICMVTGANSGLGKATSIALSRMGFTVVMVCRSLERAERARREIVAESGNGAVELMIADLARLDEVRRLAADFQQGHHRLDVLVNNAASNFPSYEETEDGLERTMALNYFSPFLLTNLLLDTLSRTSPSRVVNVSSVAHYRAALDLADINGRMDKGMLGYRAYSRSKLALTLFTYELARRARGRGTTSNCLHPGVVRTNIWSHQGVMSPLFKLASLFMKNPEKGAETIVYLASSREVEGVTGGYFVDKAQRHSSPSTYDEELAGKLWDLSVRATLDTPTVVRGN